MSEKGFKYYDFSDVCLGGTTGSTTTTAFDWMNETRVILQELIIIYSSFAAIERKPRAQSSKST